MQLKEIAKILLAKINPEIKVSYKNLTISGPYQDRGFLRALARNNREPFMVDTVLKHIDINTIFLDIGSHLGQYSLVVANELANLKRGRVYAFEPHPRSFHYLKKNIELNNLSNIISAENLCALDYSGTVTLYSDSLQSDYTSLIPGASGSSQRRAINVESIIIDDYFSKKHPPTVVKIDVEGAELSVLKSMKSIIENHQPKLFIESNADALKGAGTSPEELFSWLKGVYTHINIIDEQLKQLTPVSNPQSLRNKCINLLCMCL